MAEILIIDPEPVRRRILRVFLGPEHTVVESEDLQQANRLGGDLQFKAVFIAWGPGKTTPRGGPPEKLAFTAQNFVAILQDPEDGSKARDWGNKALPSAELLLLDAQRGSLTSAEILRVLNRIISRPVTPVPELIGSSPQMLQLLEQAGKVAANDYPAVIIGEPGTGKSTLCRWIHYLSSRGQKGGRFEEFHAGGLEPNEAYSELFGHEKGAFPWAVQPRPGLLETADGGTVYIHEGCDLNRTLQLKLLRTLDQPLMRIERLGAIESHTVDVRIVVGSRWPLRQKSSAEFSEELFYCLSCNYLEVPPLRTRTEDIPKLATYLHLRLLRARRVLSSERENGETRAPAQTPGIDREAMEVLCQYPWPGNLNELQAALSHAAMRTEGDILIKHLPQHILKAVQRMV